MGVRAEARHCTLLAVPGHWAKPNEQEHFQREVVGRPSSGQSMVSSTTICFQTKSLVFVLRKVYQYFFARHKEGCFLLCSSESHKCHHRYVGLHHRPLHRITFGSFRPQPSLVAPTRDTLTLLLAGPPDQLWGIPW